jgi:hypothetical protein
MCAIHETSGLSGSYMVDWLEISIVKSDFTKKQKWFLDKHLFTRHLVEPAKEIRLIL